MSKERIEFGWLERFAHRIDTINDKVGKIVAFLIIPLTGVIVYSVILRYIFNKPQVWTWDLSLEFFGFIILLGVGYTLLQGKHIRIDIVVSSLPQRARKIVELLALLVILFVAAILLWQGGIKGWESMLEKERLSSAWAPYVFPVKMMFPIAAILLIFQVIAQAIRLLTPPKREK